MSQHKSDRFDFSNDPFLPCTGGNTPFPFDEDPFINDSNHFTTYEQSPTYTSTNTDCNDILDDLDFDPPFAATDTPPSGSNDSSIASTLDFTDYAFGHHVRTPRSLSTYASTPVPDTPHSHPIQYPSRGRDRTNQLFYRRSLSQGDTGSIAAAGSQCSQFESPRGLTLRSRSGLRRRGVEEGNVKRSAMRFGLYQPGAKHAMRNMWSQPPSSVPTDMQGYAAREERRVSDEVVSTSEVTADNGMRIQLTRPRFMHISPDNQISVSARVIEIGAMAVVNKAKSGGLQSTEGAGSGWETEHDLLDIVDHVEAHLKQELGEGADGVKGCEMIREALTSKPGIIKRRNGR